jgi:apolipoprotein D and lipocalin family protein
MRGWKNAMMIWAAILGLGVPVFVAGANDQKRPRPNPLTVIDPVDLNRYVGRWFEIARYPNRFQKDCTADTTAEYSLRKDGKIEVLNSCKQSNQKLKKARGTARVIDKQSNAKLKVTFFWPFSGNYWVIDLDPEYGYAVIGEPDRKYLWILSRTPSLDEQTYSAIIDKIRAAGYDPAKLLKTPQTTAPNLS